MLHPDPAIVFHDMRIDNPIVKGDGTLILSYTADRPSNCVGEGTTADFYFRVLFKDGNATKARRVPDSRVATDDPAGANVPGTEIVPLKYIAPPLAPGKYSLQIIAAIKCKGEAKQFPQSPPVNFTVVE